jgi:hypothetical protein
MELLKFYIIFALFPACLFGIKLNQYKPEDRKDLTIESFGNSFSTQMSIEQNFPAIHITMHGDYNAWIHLVRTDAEDPKLREFVDTCHETYPFYTKGIAFDDAPLWHITPTHKPLTFWIGHAYAVRVDFNGKKILCLGGIKWGFTIKDNCIHPNAINPNGLTNEDWLVDQKILAKTISEYNFS